MSFLSHIEELAKAAKQLSVAIDRGDSQGNYADPSGAEPHIRLDREGFCLQTAYRVWKDVFESEHCRDIASIQADLERQKLKTAVQLGARPGVMFGSAVQAFPQPVSSPPQPTPQPPASEVAVVSARSILDDWHDSWFVESQDDKTRVLERVGEGGFRELFRLTTGCDSGDEAKSRERELLRALFFARESAATVAALRNFLAIMLAAGEEGLSASRVQEAIRRADLTLDAIQHDEPLPAWDDRPAEQPAVSE